MPPVRASNLVLLCRPRWPNQPPAPGARWQNQPQALQPWGQSFVELQTSSKMPQGLQTPLASERRAPPEAEIPISLRPQLFLSLGPGALPYLSLFLSPRPRMKPQTRQLLFCRREPRW